MASLIKGMLSMTRLLPIFDSAILELNRNARPPKRANHGARPCSSVVRRLRHGKNYKKSKENTPIEQEEIGATWDDV